MWRGARCGGKPLRQSTAMPGNPERLRNGWRNEANFCSIFNEPEAAAPRRAALTG